MPLFTKLVRFSLVGIVGAIFDFGSRTLLLHFGFLGFIARAGSYIIGSSVAYYLNSFFTFDGDRSRQEKFRASFSYALCFLTAVLVDAWFRHSFSAVSNVLFWSWFISQAAATILNFVLQNVWVFKAR